MLWRACVVDVVCEDDDTTPNCLRNLWKNLDSAIVVAVVVVVVFVVVAVSVAIVAGQTKTQKLHNF